MTHAGQLAAFRDAYREGQRLVHETADPLSHAAFNWKPSPKRWSVAECVIHLNKIAKGYLGPLEEAVADPEAPRSTRVYEAGWVGRRFRASVAPGSRPIPTGGGMKPAPAEAYSDYEKARALDSLDAYTDRFVSTIEAAVGLDLGGIKVRSPFLPIMRLPLGTWLDALGQHTIRHAQQARRVTEEPGFPGP